MGVRDQLNTDLKEAMRSKEMHHVTMIRGVMAALKEAEQRKRDDLVKVALKKHGVTRPAPVDDEEVMKQIMKQFDQEVLAALDAEKVEDKAGLDEGESLGVIQKLIKMRQDTIADAEKAGRQDIGDSEKQELAWLQAYLPKQLSREEVEAEARAVIALVGASSPKDMGKVMGPLTGKLKGKADGKLISEVVKLLLGG